MNPNQPQPMPLLDYYLLLEKHDWFFDYTEDPTVWRRGQAAHAHLQQIAKTSPEHQALYQKYRDYVFSGASFDKERLPKPEKPA